MLTLLIIRYGFDKIHLIFTLKINSMKILFFFLVVFSFTIFGQEALVNNGSFQLHGNVQMGIFGDFSNNHNSTNNAGDIHLIGTTLQNFTGSNALNANNLFVNNSNNIKVDNELQVTNTLVFSNGSIFTDRADAATEFVHFLNGSSYSGESDNRFIDGVVRKTGSQSFVFPVGESGQIQPIAISSPSNPTSHFTAHYIENDPHLDGYSRLSKEPSIHHVSACEYWILNRTAGSDNVQVSLNFDSHSCGVTELSELLVTRWDGSEWKDHGNGGTTGNVTAGTLTSNGTVSSFSPFTLSSSTSNNPLPIELLSFEIESVTDNAALLTWVTASEINNEYFDLEKSHDTQNWNTINTQLGAGNSVDENNYDFTDRNLVPGIQYYRLKQVDFDGQFEYSDILSINHSHQNSTLYPNPNNGNFTIHFTQPLKEVGLKIVNNLGKIVYTETLVNTESIINFEINLPRGTYQLGIASNSEVEHHKFVVQ